MKTIKFSILSLVIVIVTSPGFAEYLTPELLKCPQWKSSWCWAGAAQACLTYYGIDHDSVSNEDCAHVITTNNDPQPMRVITTIINHFLPGYAYSPKNDLKSEAAYKAEADSGAPFACFWPGHFVTYAGYEGDKHLIMNPAPWGTDSNTAGRWEENLSYSYIANKTSNYVRTKGRPRKPYIAVNTPADGQEIQQNSVVTVKWADNIDGEVKIELLKSDAVNKVLIASTPSNGSWEWEVTTDFEVGDDYKIQITSVDSAALTTKNEKPFKIIEEYIIVDFPHVQTFDNMDTSRIRPLSEKWEQLDGDDFDWIVLSGPTPSNQYESTGPSADHTSGNGNYVYVEASNPNNPEKTTKMISPKFNLKGVTAPELIFWCHMWSDSNTMGNLYVDIEVDGVLKEGVVHLKDDHGKEWFEVKQDLSQYVGERVRFLFRGTTGTSWCGDMAVDDFQVDGATPITVTPEVPVAYELALHGSRLFYRIPETGSRKPLTIKLYNTKGTCVQTLVDSPARAGNNAVSLEQTSSGTALSSGTYLCRMKTGDFKKTITVMLRK